MQLHLVPTLTTSQSSDIQDTSVKIINWSLKSELLSDQTVIQAASE